MLLLHIDKQDVNFLRNIAVFREIHQRNAVRASISQAPLKDRQLRKIVSDLNISDYVQRYGQNISFETIEKVEVDFGLNCRIWREKRSSIDNVRQRTVELIWEGPNIEGLKIDLFAKEFDPFIHREFGEFSLILNLTQFLRVKKYCPKSNPIAQRKMTLFQCLVTCKHPGLWGDQFDQKVRAYQEEWGSDSFTLAENRRFYRLFGFGFEIWEKQHENGRKVFTKVFDSFWKAKIMILVENFDMSDPKIAINQTLVLVQKPESLNLFFCPIPNCFFWNQSLSGVSKAHCILPEYNFDRKETKKVQ